MKMRKLMCVFLGMLLLFSGISVVYAEEENKEASVEPRQQGVYYVFDKIRESRDESTGSVLKLSADITGPGTVTVSFTRTITSSFNISMPANSIPAVFSTVNASVGMSLSNATTYAFPVDSGRTGYIAFKPYYQYVEGNLKEYNSAYPGVVISRRPMVAKFPLKTDLGHAEGRAYLEYK